MWCNAKETCDLWRGAVLTVPQNVSVAAHLQSLSPSDRGKLYQNVLAAQTWINKARANIEAFAIEHGGAQIDGYEVVDARANRVWSDDEQAKAAMLDLCAVKGIDADNVVVPEAVIGPAAADKLFGKGKIVRERLDHLVMSMPTGKKSLRKQRVLS